MADNGMDRRDFMKSTAAGFGGFFFLSSSVILTTYNFKQKHHVEIGEGKRMRANKKGRE